MISLIESICWHDEFENLIKETIENSESDSKVEIYYEYVSIDD